MAVATVSAAIAAFRATIDVAKGAIAARDDALIVKVIGDMNDRMLDIQSQCLALQEKLSALADSERDLKEKLRKMEEKAADLDQYELHQNSQGAIMYRSKHSLDPTNKPIYLCANCVAAGIKTFLQQQPKGLATMLNCKEHGDIRSDIPNKKVQIPRFA
jgi:hypothetical protein